MGNASVLPAVTVEDVTHHYGSVRAVNAVSLAIHPGEVVCLLGPSGCGKTTLLRLVAGLELLQDGRILLGNLVVASRTHVVPPERRQVGMLFQDYALFPHLTVGQNVAFGLRSMPESEKRKRTLMLLQRVQVAEMVDRYPHTLSGGQQQRVALARALAPGPRVMLLDEPFSGLDTRLREEVRDETLAVLKESGATALMVTHDPAEAMAMGDRVAVMRSGEIQQIGTPDEVYSHPATPFVAETLGPVNRLEGVVQDGHLRTQLGIIQSRHATEGARVSVLVRPEGIALLRDAELADDCATARVVSVRRLGPISIVEIASLDVPDHQLTRAIEFGAASVSVGDIVAISVDPRHAFVFPLAG
ncbi:MAG: ABC transporter ATP-binding protein [Chloroflexota bacterium]